MNSRHYSSFLLRLWLVNAKTEASRETEKPAQKANETVPADSTMVMQLQHLQSGTTWRFNNLKELNELLSRISDDETPERWLKRPISPENEKVTETETK